MCVHAHTCYPDLVSGQSLGDTRCPKADILSLTSKSTQIPLKGKEKKNRKRGLPPHSSHLLHKYTHEMVSSLCLKCSTALKPKEGKESQTPKITKEMKLTTRLQHNRKYEISESVLLFPM